MGERADLHGGGQHGLRDLAVALRGGRFDPVALLPGPGPLAESLQRAGAAWEALPLPPLRSPAAPLALLRLIRRVRRGGVDLLHSAAPRTAIYAGLAARLTGRRHLFHVRSSLAAGGPIEALLVRLSDRVVAVSEAAAGRSAALRGAVDRVRVVPTGLPAIPFLGRGEARALLGLPEEPFVAAVVGRIEADKGPEEAVAALPAIRRARPGALLTFLGACDRGSPLLQSLRDRAAALGAGDALRFAGARDEAAPLLRAFDLILHPARHEALPRALIEALFAGVPVVAFAVGGVPEVIEDGRTGLLIPPGDARALAGAAGALAADPARLEALGAAGPAAAGRRFRLATMLARLEGLYDEALFGPSPAAGRRARAVAP